LQASIDRPTTRESGFFKQYLACCIGANQYEYLLADGSGLNVSDDRQFNYYPQGT